MNPAYEQLMRAAQILIANAAFPDDDACSEFQTVWCEDVDALQQAIWECEKEDSR